MKRLIFVLISLFVALAAYSQNEETFKSLKKKFKKQRVFVLDLDLSDVKYGTMPYERFKERVSIKDDIDPLLVDMSIEDYEKSFYCTYKGLTFVKKPSAEIPFSIHVKVDEISSKAAIKAKALITYNDSLDFAEIDLDVEEGKWNSFDVLLKENQEEQLKKLCNSLLYYSNRNSTYTVNRRSSLRFLDGKK